MSWKQVRHPQSRYQPQPTPNLPISCVASQTADVFVSESRNRQAHRSSSRGFSYRLERRVSSADLRVCL